MVLLEQELNQNKKSFLVWTLSISILVILVIFVYSEMKKSIADIEMIYGQLGDFSKMFGLDKLSMGSLMGFYGMEIGNILGLGGALYAAILGISSLSKEEDDHTTEYLFAHPITRLSVVSQKYVAMILQIIELNIITLIFSLLAAIIIKENNPTSEFVQYHVASLMMQL